MRIRTILGEVLPVLGTIGLLGLWAFQQVGIEDRAAELRKLAAARAVYQLYQSHNAIFNAIIETTTSNETVIHKIRTIQIYNYELGLRAIENALPDSARAGISSWAEASTGSEEEVNRTQARLEQLQDRLEKREAAVSEQAGAARYIYLWVYIALSMMMAAGAAMKAMDKLYSKST
jgi:hypothetical protein